MKILSNLPSPDINEIYLDICLQSKSGCNVKVGDKLYNISTEPCGTYVVNEIVLNVELSEEEFKRFKK